MPFTPFTPLMTATAKILHLAIIPDMLTRTQQLSSDPGFRGA